MRTKFPALTLAAFLLLGIFSALPAAAEPRGAGLNGLWAQLLSFFTSALGDAGCVIDPNGRCHEHADLGCALEPNGSCRAGSGGLAQVDGGCVIDPYGGCDK
jgi:hypothetical protein